MRALDGVVTTISPFNILQKKLTPKGYHQNGLNVLWAQQITI